jgi:RNA polymerase sigma factor (sigma-70 family)
LKKYTSEKILKGILENDRRIIEYVYNTYFNAIKSFVLRYGGNHEDAWDIFQDGIVIIYEQARKEDLQIENSFMTYLFTICKYQWLKALRDRNKKYFETIENNKEVEQFFHQENAARLDEIIEKEKRLKLYASNFRKLSESCQKMLKLVARGLTVEELKQELGYKSNGFTYKKRSECKERLIKLINKDKLDH